MNTKRRRTARKSKGTKTKKPKFLSLSVQFSADETNQIRRSRMRHNITSPVTAADISSDHLNLVPLQKENHLEERESDDHENVAFFFSASDGGATTLTGLLDTSSAAESSSPVTNNNSSRLDYLSPPSPTTLTQAYGEDRTELVRNALRNRDRDSSDEKWVRYSEVVKEEEVTSSAVDPPRLAGIQRMSLKLDYEGIMNAWSNKGPLYIDAPPDNSHIVPDINHSFLLQGPSCYDLGCDGGSWMVPEMVEKNNGDDELMKMGQREASVLRYKEKRRNRLFSKRIRYQVRKLNAEKRPRLKGRFVKRG